MIGGGIKGIAFTTVEACKEECAKTEGCVAFTTYAGTDNKCWLKNKDHDAESVSARTISARMRCYEGKGSTRVHKMFQTIQSKNCIDMNCTDVPTHVVLGSRF